MQKAQLRNLLIRLRNRAMQCPGGEGGIRTRGGLLTHTRFPGVRLKPLIHLSGKPCILAESLRWSNNLSEKSESDPEQEQDYETNNAYGLPREPRQDRGDELPRGAGNQVEKLIDPVVFPPAPCQDMQHPLADQAKAQHLDDGTSRADQKQLHPD